MRLSTLGRAMRQYATFDDSLPDRRFFERYGVDKAAARLSAGDYELIRGVDMKSAADGSPMIIAASAEMPDLKPTPVATISGAPGDRVSLTETQATFFARAGYIRNTPALLDRAAVLNAQVAKLQEALVALPPLDTSLAISTSGRRLAAVRTRLQAERDQAARMVDSGGSSTDDRQDFAAIDAALTDLDRRASDDVEWVESGIGSVPVGHPRSGLRFALGEAVPLLPGEEGRIRELVRPLGSHRTRQRQDLTDRIEKISRDTVELNVAAGVG